MDRMDNLNNAVFNIATQNLTLETPPVALMFSGFSKNYHIYYYIFSFILQNHLKFATIIFNTLTNGKGLFT